MSLKVNNDASGIGNLFMKEFGLIQHVKSQTHKSGSLLDHFKSSGETRVDVKSNTFLTNSDNSLNCFSVSNWKLSKPSRQIFYRNWKLFRSDLYLDSQLSTLSIEQTSGVDKTWNDYLAADENILNDYLPLKSNIFFDHKCPFYDKELVFLRRKKWKKERL